MKLDSLEVSVNGVVVRLVKFHKGLNLITNTPNSGRTGNSVGKSTLSRVVDFLMLGNISSIYIDEEFKKPNKEIESLFTENDAVATLYFTDQEEKRRRISRALKIENSDQACFVDGDEVSLKKYEKFLQKSIFDVESKRPSVRSVAPKFVRNSSHRMLSTTKFLDSHSAASDYSELFLYLFGFQNSDLLTEKRAANNLLKRRQRNTTSLNAIVSEQKPAQEIKKYTVDAKQLEENLLTFEYSPEYNNPIQRLSQLQDEEDTSTTALLFTERRIENIKKTIELLSEDESGYLIGQLEAIYEYSGIAIDSALRSLEEVIQFHNVLVNEKKKYLNIGMPDLLEEKELISAEIMAIQRNKARVFSDMKSQESLDNITSKLKRLGELNVELGKLQGLVSQQTKAKTNLDLAATDLSRILELIEKEVDNVYSFQEKFNEHLGLITKKLHDEEYAVKVDFDKDSGKCEIEIKNTATNPEGGKKKAEVIAFDFAYIHTVHELSLKRPNFVFHDSIEDIDSNQIDDILYLSKLLPGQQILSMLSDKISDKTYKKYSNKIVLLLDEDNRFFGV